MQNVVVRYAGAPAHRVVEGNQGTSSSSNSTGYHGNTTSTSIQAKVDELLAWQLQETDFLSTLTPPNAHTDKSSAESSAASEMVQSSQTANPGVAHRQDEFDPDSMSYEELQALGENVGSENRGLTDELISYLRSSKYKSSSGFFSRKKECKECAICLLVVKNREKLIYLPCSHDFHDRCIRRWLKQDRTCPVCKYEVFGPK